MVAIGAVKTKSPTPTAAILALLPSFPKLQSKESLGMGKSGENLEKPLEVHACTTVLWGRRTKTYFPKTLNSGVDNLCGSYQRAVCLMCACVPLVFY